MPGYESMLRMAAQIVDEAAPHGGVVLVIGAGGGLEIEALSLASKDRLFVAVDPDPVMLDSARERVRDLGASSRVTWVEGVIHDAPKDIVCDAATCLLTLHFVPDDGAKLATLREVRARLRPGAPFVLVDFSLDRAAPDFELWLSRYQTFGVNGGIEPESAAAAIQEIRSGELPVISPQRTEALLREAGFSNPQLFFAGLSWRGWITYA